VAVSEAIHLLDSGQARVAEQQGVGDWTVNEWLFVVLDRYMDTYNIIHNRNPF
jgi:tetrahydrodipicolinate N-succinyltransferase